jgi:hypothetical protein
MEDSLALFKALSSANFRYSGWLTDDSFSFL